MTNHSPVNDDAELRAAHALNDYLEALERGEQPAPPDLGGTADATDLAGMAMLLRAAGDAANPATPLAAPTSASTAGGPVERPTGRSRRPSRRALLVSGLAAAAGLAAGVGAGAVLTRAGTNPGATTDHWDVPLVGLGGVWLTVATVNELAPGAIKAFTTPQVSGHLLRRPDGTYLALSAACTHMGCLLNWNDAARTFDCPCHNGRFDSEGQFVVGLVRYLPLPRLHTQIAGDAVQVFVPVPLPASPAANSPTGTPATGENYP